MTQYFVVDKASGRIINAVMTLKPRAEAEALWRDGYALKTEDELSESQLEAYEFWNERP